MTNNQTFFSFLETNLSFLILILGAVLCAWFVVYGLPFIEKIIDEMLYDQMIHMNSTVGEI